MKYSNILWITIIGAALLTGCAGTGQMAQSPSDLAEQVQPVMPPKAEIEAKVAQELEDLGEKELAREEREAAAQQGGEEKAEEEGITYDIPITINAKVMSFIEAFQRPSLAKHFRIWLARSGRYAPMMREILKSHGLPEDLVYLAMIESGFKCNISSPAHAVGPWQFIRGTGRRYGLRIDSWVDERRDPVKATHAAARYLKDLYTEFGSWYLAAAAYNAGEAKVRRALKRNKGGDYWDISQRRSRYLKRETQQYVPKMIAAAIIAKEPEKYGFGGIEYEQPLAFDVVQVDPMTSLGVAAKACGSTTRQIYTLNPELKSWATPPSRSGTYSLRIPEGSQGTFLAAYNQLSPNQRRARVGAVKVKVARGDTLGKIAMRHHVRLQDLMAMNPRLDSRRLSIGQTVVVPPRAFGGRGVSRLPAACPVPEKPTQLAGAPRGDYTQVQLGHGDTLGKLAMRYGVSVDRMRAANPGLDPRRLQVGQTVNIPPNAGAKAQAATAPAPAPAKPSPATTAHRIKGTRKVVHVVRRGDSLWEIAQRYGVEPRDLKGWNGLRSSRLQVGDRLVVHVGLAQAEARQETRLAAVDTGQDFYLVQKGDNLWNISRRFKVTPATLRRWNGLTSNRITPGDRLKVRPGQDS